jgi:Flp pilus assembly protein protease CpaA
MIPLHATTELGTVASTALYTTQKTRWAAALVLPLVVGLVWCLAWQWSDSWLGSLAGFVLLAVLTTSAITDVHGRRIYNWATYSAVLWALSINVAASLLSSAGEGSTFELHRIVTIGPPWLGGVGLSQSAAGAALCFAITLAGYHLSGRGAGDVKLAAAIGALLGIEGIYAVAYSYMVAAVAIVVWSIYCHGPLALVKAAGRTIGSLLGPIWPFPPATADKAFLTQPIPLGPYFAIGTLLVVLELVPS